VLTTLYIGAPGEEGNETAEEVMALAVPDLCAIKNHKFLGITCSCLVFCSSRILDHFFVLCSP
jgi:hypothetical protein